MKVDKELVGKMAELSRVKLSELEIVQLEKEFADIFGYFSRISEICGKGGQLFYVTGAKGGLRSDSAKVRAKGEVDAIVENFTQKSSRLLVAPKTLD